MGGGCGLSWDGCRQWRRVSMDLKVGVGWGWRAVSCKGGGEGGRCGGGAGLDGGVQEGIVDWVR